MNLRTILVTSAALGAILTGPAVLEAATGSDGGPHARVQEQAQQQAPPVNLNAATADQLQVLPGIGPATAQRIIAYREANGPFKKIEDLMNVKGIGEKTFLRLKSLVVVEPPKAGGR